MDNFDLEYYFTAEAYRDTSNITPRLAAAAQAINEEGIRGRGGNKQSEYNAVSHSTPGYYPGETCHLLGVDLDDDKYLHSMTITVQYELANHGLMFNSFYTDRFTGYRDGIEPIEHDWIFHVVDLTWLPDQWI